MSTHHRYTTPAKAHDQTSDAASRVVLSAAQGPDAQEPLGSQPSHDDALDLAVEYSFPCSDPIAVQSRCATAASRQSQATAGNKLPGGCTDGWRDW